VSIPSAIQQQARAAYRVFETNPQYPGLRFHTVTVKRTKKTLYSVSIGIHYRALAQEKDGGLAWFWIGHHSVYDKLLEGR
jgi:hypothetical protein